MNYEKASVVATSNHMTRWGGTEHLIGWEIFGKLKNALWRFAPSILKADCERFSNEDGYHILWQFSDTVDGTWWIGVLLDGEWKHFEMDLGNPSHRGAFRRGGGWSGI